MAAARQAAGWGMRVRAGACLAALALAAGAVHAQPWLPAAQSAAQAELADEFGYAAPVALASPSVSALSPTVAGLSGVYRAAVSGTSWIAWGLLDDGGAPVVSALARSDDPADALPLVAPQLGAFWKGDPQGSLFFDLVQYLGAHANPPAAPLSVELRQSTIRAILDLYHADASRDVGSFDQLAQPLAAVLRELDFPADLTARDIGRVRAEWDLADPQHAETMAFDYSSLYFALYARGRSDAAVLPLMADLVSTVTAADRSLHPAFGVLLSLVVQHHLYLLPGLGEPAIPGRDPLAVYRFVTAWRAVHDPAAVASSQVADAAYRLTSYLDPAAPELAQSLALAREETAALAASAATQTNISTGLAVIGLLTSTWLSPDPGRFGDLDALLRGQFLQHLVDGFDSLSGSPPAEDDVVRFLAWALVHGSVPAAQAGPVAAFLSGQLDARVAAILATPLPLPDAFDSAYQRQVAIAAAIAKAIGRREALDPYLDLFLAPFPGSTYLPAEPPERFAARRALVLSLWHEQGTLLVDRGNYLGRDAEALAAFASYLRAAAPILGIAHHAIFLAHLDPGDVDGGPAGLEGWVWFPNYVDDNDTPASLDLLRINELEFLEHETGHNLHRGALPHPADIAIAQLYERSDLTPDPDDFMQTTLWGYGSGSYTEEAAESVTGFFDDARGHLDRALAVAGQGKLLLLQKYLTWAAEIARLAQDGDAFPLYRRVVTPGPLPAGTHIEFRLVDRLRILAHDASGRIVRMSDARATYSFTYSGRELAGVATGPPAGFDFYTLPPCRLVDTRGPAGATGGPALGAGSRRDLAVTGACGIPADARALAVNVTVTQPSAAGHLTLFPADLAAAPEASTINFSAGQTRANQAIVPLALDGSGALAVQVGSAGSVHLVLDVSGYFR